MIDRGGLWLCHEFYTRVMVLAKKRPRDFAPDASGMLRQKYCSSSDCSLTKEGIESVETFDEDLDSPVRKRENAQLYSRERMSTDQAVTKTEPPMGAGFHTNMIADFGEKGREL